MGELLDGRWYRKEDCVFNPHVWGNYNPADPKEGIKCPKDKFEVLQSRAGGFSSAIAGNTDPSDAARSLAVQHHLGKRFPIIEDSAQINRRGALPSVRAG